MSLRAPTTWEEVPAYVRAVLTRPVAKVGADGVPVLSHAADVLGWRAGPINAMWGGPRPLTNLLIGSGLGAVGGHLTGHLATKLLPDRYFDPAAVKRRAMILGAALGSAVPAYQAYDTVRISGSWGGLLDEYPTKVAQDLFAPVIPVDQFNRVVMADPNTPWNVRAATAGLVEAADAVRGGQDRWVSPFDVARVAAGAGVGLLSGVVAGKALGMLAGLTPETQQQIQRLGLWAGIVRSVVPQALGLR